MPMKNMKNPAQNASGSDLPETAVQDVVPGKKVRDIPLSNEERSDELPQKNPTIAWPPAEAPDHKPMKNMK